MTRFGLYVRCLSSSMRHSTAVNQSRKTTVGISTKSKIISVATAAAAGLIATILIEPKHITQLGDIVGMKFLHMLDPETAHRVAVQAAALGLVKDITKDDKILSTQVFGKIFSNPIGMAAGFDKNAEAISGILDMGFGFVEIGSVTPFPQPGNPRPRVFRLTEDRAIINRYGFNSDGAAIVKDRLEKFMKTTRKTTGSERIRNGILGVNLGKNKTSEDAAVDYVTGVRSLSPFADYIVINVSSPNTPDLRKLQGRHQLMKLVSNVLKERNLTEKKPALLIKIAPDLQASEREDIAQVALSLGVDGIIVCNTTIERPNCLLSIHRHEIGGLSGAPLREASTKAVFEMYRLTKGKIPLVGVGGVATGNDAYEKIRAGASLVQIYSSMVYDGPGSIVRIKNELAECLKSNGYNSVQEAVGGAHINL